MTTTPTREAVDITETYDGCEVHVRMRLSSVVARIGAGDEGPRPEHRYAAYLRSADGQSEVLLGYGRTYREAGLAAVGEIDVASLELDEGSEIVVCPLPASDWSPTHRMQS